MFDQWDQLQALYDKVCQELTQANIDQRRRAVLQRKASQCNNVLEKHKEMKEAQEQLVYVEQQAKENSDPEMAELFKQELIDVQDIITKKQVEIETLMYPADEFANRAAYLEIRAGAGGQEAALFVGDLLKMYSHFAEREGWQIELTSESKTDIGGYKEVVLFIQGSNVYEALRSESGVHRVQRVPATETAGRVHTSTVTVAVMPEIEEVDITINPSDLRVDVYRASGAGGQHVNKTESAVRLTHIPTGVAVASQEERSQHKNKARALKMLRARLFAFEEEKRNAERSKSRKEQVGTGMRSEKIRTYNYPQNRVTDHQVDITIKNLDMFMLGHMEEVIDALKIKHQKELQQQSSLLEFE